MHLVNFANMKYLNTENLVKTLSFLRRYISAAYITMFVAAFLLWYITKLGETYTTDHKVTVVIDGEDYVVDCTIRGKGIDLIDYTMSSSRSRFVISSLELSYDKEVHNNDGTITRHLSTVSLQQALAARMSDIEVVAVGSVPAFTFEDESRVVSNEVPSEESSVQLSPSQEVAPVTSTEPEVHRPNHPSKPKTTAPVTTIQLSDKDSHIKY